MEMFAKIKGSKTPGRDVAEMMERIREQINGKLEDSERARKEREDSERKQNGAKGKGKKRARQEEQDKANKGKAKERKIWGDEDEDQLNQTLMEAAEAVEEAEASMSELDQVFRWEDNGSQDLPHPSGCSTPTPRDEAIKEAGGRRSNKGGDKMESAARDRKRSSTLMATEEERYGREQELGKVKIRQVEILQPVVKVTRLQIDETKGNKMETAEAVDKGEKEKGTGAKQEEEQKLIRLIKEMRANFEKDKEVRNKRSEEKQGGDGENGNRGENRETREGKKQRKGGTEWEEGKGARKGRKGGNRGEEVILIKYPKEDIGYWGAVKWLKTVVGEFAGNFQEIRDTRKGDILIAVKNGKGGESSRECSRKINREGEGRWYARVHSDTVEIAIKISDPDLEKEELLIAYGESRLGKFVENGDIRIRCIKGPEGTCHRTAYLDCTREAAKEMVQEKEIRTKWQELRPYFPRRKPEGEDRRTKKDGKDDAGARMEAGKEDKEVAEMERWAKPGTSKEPW
nr:PREDICTED: DNA ligase 1-like [Megachile rotundata]